MQKSIHPAQDVISKTERMSTSSLTVTLGRGNRGKSYWGHWCIDRALNAGRDVLVADFDRLNASLRALYQDRCLVPVSALDADVEERLREVTEGLKSQPRPAIIDFGAGDQTLKKVSRKLGGFVGFLEQEGLAVTAVHLLGPNTDDLANLRDLEPQPQSATKLERAGVFAPKHTILVLNEALVPEGSSTERTFKQVTEHRVFLAAVERGAMPILMPKLQAEVARDITSKLLGFIAAQEGRPGPDGTSIGPWNRSLIKAWREAMEENHAAVREWLL